MSTPYEHEGEFGEYELGEFGETELEGERGRYRRWGGPPRRLPRRIRRRPVSTMAVLPRRRRRRWPVVSFGGGWPQPVAAEPEPFPDQPLPAAPSEPLPPMGEPPAPADDGAAPPSADEPAGAPPDGPPEESTEYELNVQPETFEAYSEFGETESFETGMPVRPPPSATAAACAGLKQPEVVDRFAFDRDGLTPAHLARLKRIAQCIVASQRTRSPVRRVRLVGHTDPAGPPAYNQALGQRRAARVQQALRSAIDALQPGLSARLSFAVESRGEDVPIPGNAPASRRVEIFLQRVAKPPVRRGCPPFKERIRLHLKILVPPRRFSIATMLRSMRQVYGPAGFRVEVASTERLRLPALEDLDIFCPGAATQVCCPFPCPTNRLNPEHVALFRNRNRVRVNEIAVYFVRSTVPGFNGCCAHPAGRPGVVVTTNASQWTLGHEVGHVLGLPHVNNSDRLMTGGGTNNITNPPPDSDCFRDTDHGAEPFDHPLLKEAPMAIPIEQLRRALGTDEPNYDALRRLGPSIVPLLLRLVRDRDEYIAANAASLAGMIGGPAASVLQQAVRSPAATVRIAAAGALRHVRSPAARRLASSLLADPNPGVRKFASKAAGRAAPSSSTRVAGVQRPGGPRTA